MEIVKRTTCIAVEVCVQYKLHVMPELEIKESRLCKTHITWKISANSHFFFVPADKKSIH